MMNHHWAKNFDLEIQPDQRRSQSNTVLHPTAFPIYLFAKALHTRCGIATSCYQVLELYAMANTLLDISGHSYGQNLPKIKEIRLVYLFL